MPRSCAIRIRCSAGRLHNKVVFHTMKALNGFGFPVLRFQFPRNRTERRRARARRRGGGRRADGARLAGTRVRVAGDLRRIFVWRGGGTAGGVSGSRVTALIGLGLPTVPVDDRVYDFEFLRSCAKPKLFVSGSRDQFGPPGKLEALVGNFRRTEENWCASKLGTTFLRDG